MIQEKEQVCKKLVKYAFLGYANIKILWEKDYGSQVDKREKCSTF